MTNALHPADKPPLEQNHGTFESAGSSSIHHNQEYRELKRLIFWVLASSIPLTALTVGIGIISNSLAINAVAVDAGSCLVFHLFNMISIRIILRQNSFNYPYGTGKLENFSGFLYAAIALTGAMLIIVSAVKRYLAPPVAIELGSAQVLLVLWFVRDTGLYVWSVRICRRFPDHSPMTQSYLVSNKITMIYDLAVLAGVIFCFWMFSTGRSWIGNVVDLIIALAVVGYMCYCAIGLLVRNFRSLIDMPLPETDQLKILYALTADFDAYEGIGNIYSQLSGSARMIQIELYFERSVTVEEIEQLRSRIEERLRVHYNNLLFHLIPLVHKA